MTTKSTIPTTPEAAPEKKAKNEDAAAWGQQPHAHVVYSHSEGEVEVESKWL